MILCINGSRNYTNYEDFYNDVEAFIIQVIFLSGKDVTEIISGGARGPDRMAERYARENHIKFTEYPADWNKHGKAAGYIRNAQMADNCDILLSFWDGESRGTANMISEMNLREKPVHIVKISV